MKLRLGCRVVCTDGSHEGKRGRIVYDEAIAMALGSFVTVHFDGELFDFRVPRHLVEAASVIDMLASIQLEEEA